MEKEQEQRGAKKAEEKGGKGLEELHMEDSPYVNYGDLEDYKRKAYGTSGHREPQIGRGAGVTDAPTLSGGNVSTQADVPAADKSAINR